MTARTLGTLLLLFTFATARGEAPAPHPFFAFENGMPDPKHAEQARLLKKLGYHGISQVKKGGKDLADRIEAFRSEGLKVLSIYLDAGKLPFPPESYAALGKSGGMIELTVQKAIPETVASIRQLAADAESLNIRVALYPHHGFAVATMPQAIALAEEVDHPNLGIMFNLCHFLKNEQAGDLEAVLTKAAPRLFSVSTCGADSDGTDWKTLIQPLDQGSFPQRRLLEALGKIGYRGPVTLQCFNIKGDKQTNLKRSIAAWRDIVKPPSTPTH